jgi:hypothetical protein
MMNKKGFSLASFVVAMLIFSGIVALFVLAVGSLAHDYGNENVVDPAFSAKFDRFENETARTSQMWDKVTGEGGLSLAGTAELLFTSTFSVIRLVGSSVVESSRQLFGIGTFFGIPSNVGAIIFVMIFAILTVIIVFRILNSVRGNKEL